MHHLLSKKITLKIKKSRNDFDDLVMKEKPDISWDQVIGLNDAKNALRESIVYPAKRPDLLPLGWPHGILLYGPPGCGKTILGSIELHTRHKSNKIPTNSLEYKTKNIICMHPLWCNSMATEQTHKLITVTAKAAEKMARVYSAQEAEKPEFLRVYVQGGGCSGLSYGMGFEKAADRR